VAVGLDRQPCPVGFRANDVADHAYEPPTLLLRLVLIVGLPDLGAGFFARGGPQDDVVVFVFAHFVVQRPKTPAPKRPAQITAEASWHVARATMPAWRQPRRNTIVRTCGFFMY
jgi:hypothetical protein